MNCQKGSYDVEYYYYYYYYYYGGGYCYYLYYYDDEVGIAGHKKNFHEDDRESGLVYSFDEELKARRRFQKRSQTNSHSGGRK